MQSESRCKLIDLYLKRVGIVLCCLALIFIFLYLPYLERCCIVKEHINVYTWAEMFDKADIQAFEKQTNIAVNLIYYDNCEELLTKLEITKGRTCDLLLLADCSIHDLISMDLLALIDKSKLDFWQELEPELLNQAYDLGNNYSLPYSWDIYGIGVNLEKFDYKLPNPSWGLIFDAALGVNNIGMFEDGLSSVSIAAQYLYQKCALLNFDQLNQIKNLLVQQKQHVEAYTALRGDYLLSSGACPVVATQAACIYRAMQKNSKIKFLIPQEGGFISTESFAIFKCSTKHDLVYKFINYMFKKEVVHNYINKTKFLPSRRDVFWEINLDYLGDKALILNNLSMAKIAFFTYMVPREEIMKLWMEVKAT